MPPSDFQKLQLIKPTEILKQVKNSAHVPNVKMSALLLEVLAQRFDNGEKLEPFEIDLLASYLESLKPPTRQNFILFVSKKGEAALLRRLAENACDLLASNQLCKALNEKEIHQRLPEVFEKSRYTELLAFASNPVNKEKLLNSTVVDSVRRLLTLNWRIEPNQLSIGQKSWARELVENREISELFVDEFDLLFNFLSKYFENDRKTLEAIDACLGRQLDKLKGDLSGEVFDRDKGYQKFLKLAQEGKRLSADLKNIDRLKLMIESLHKNLEILSESVPERGIYWKDHLKRFTKIIRQERKSGQYRVCVAFYYNGYVLCEFGPVGNAIYVYTEESFSDVRNFEDWKQKARTHRIKEYTTADGTIPHFYEWQTKVDNLLRFIERDF